jgi:hypothetical protein
MTTDVIRVSSPDLFAPNESLLLDIERARRLTRSVPPIAAVSYVVKKSSPFENLSTLMDACAQCVANVIYDNTGLDGYRVGLLVANGTWQPPSRLVKYKKLWKKRSEIVEAIRPSTINDEVMFERDNEIRYAGLLVVKRDRFAHAAQIVREIGACALLASKRDDFGTSEDITALFSAVFPPVHGVNDTSVDWLSLSLRSCPLGDIVVRASGLFDDPDAAIDLIFNPTLIASDTL